MKKNVWVIVLFMMAFAFGGGCLMVVGSAVTALDRDRVEPIRKESVLKVKLEGVIIDVDDFLKDLKRYRENENIKAVVVVINSPGGIVGPSQELYEEIKRTREEFNKPVVVSVPSLAASGGYYAAAAADLIYANPGSMIGSIGVIMEFANLERLYEWAKIKRFSINTGRYKDSGASYRAMREDERVVFQEMLDEVLVQFKTAISKGRRIPMSQVDPLADGRVFTGLTAKKLKLIDEVGTYADAVKKAAELGGIEGKPRVFAPEKRKDNFLDIVMGYEESRWEQTLFRQLHMELYGQPLYLMPGIWPTLR